MDSMSGCDIRLVFTFPPKDSTLQYKKCVHLWNSFPCISTLIDLTLLGLLVYSNILSNGKRISKWSSMQRGQCWIHNGTLKSFDWLNLILYIYVFVHFHLRVFSKMSCVLLANDFQNWTYFPVLKTTISSTF